MYNILLILRFYKKLDLDKVKRKPEGDDESIEDVDDEEFERALGKATHTVLFLLSGK